jgi:DNA-binding XRE family transcriptional regulator
MKMVNNLPEIIKAKQDAYRNEHHKELTEFHMAIAIGINPTTLSNYKNMKVTCLNWEVWEKLATYFGVSGSELFDLVPDDTKG